MELEEMVTKLMNHIDITVAKNKNDIIREVHVLIDEKIDESKNDIIREVNVLMENQQKQFNTLGEGLDILRDEMNRRFDENDSEHARMNRRFDQNDSEHASLKLMIRELSTDQKELKQN